MSMKRTFSLERNLGKISLVWFGISKHLHTSKRLVTEVHCTHVV